MVEQPQSFPPMPEIRRPETYYAKLVRDADKSGNQHAHEAAKVGQYITLALDPDLDWTEKVRYFQHAIKRHCNPPPLPDEEVWSFYKQLADLVRQHAGQEALKLASAEDDMYAARLGMGQDREKIEEDAETFFAKLLGIGDDCPPWFNEVDWAQLKLIRDQWI
jgi:hypothetical protein